MTAAKARRRLTAPKAEPTEEERFAAELARADQARTSSERAAQIAKQRVDASKRVPRLIERGLLPAHLSSSEDMRADNDVRTTPEGTEDALAALTVALQDLAATNGGVLGKLLPEALAALLLEAVEPETRTALSRIPQPMVSVERSLAHVDAMGLGVSERLSASIARRLTLVLLNSASVRSPIQRIVMPDLEEPPAAVEQPTQEEATEVVQVHDSDKEAIAASHASGRATRGYVMAKSHVAWAGSVAPMVEGACMELLVPTEQERDRAKASVPGQSDMVVVWWDHKARLIDPSLVERVGRDEWARWCSEEMANE